MDICQIGLGAWGKNHARVLSELRDEGLIDNLYFYDLDKNLQRRTVSMFKGQGVENIQELDVDLVDIVVPANQHYAVAKPFLEKGIKTFIEKPFTDSLEDAQELMDVCENPSKQIMVGHLFRYHVGVDLAKKLINRGAIGKPKKIDIRRLAFRKPRDDNGVILSLAIHDLDLFCYFNDEEDPKSITAITSAIEGPTEDHAFIKVQFDEITALAEETWMSSTTGKVRECRIQGTNGVIKFDFSNPSQAEVYAKYLDENGNIVDNGSFIHQTEFKEPLKAELKDFIIKSQNDEPYRTGPKVGIRAMKMCFKAIESGSTGRTLAYQ